MKETPPSQITNKKPPDALIDIIRLAGISGMGGAGFPTAKKIQSGFVVPRFLSLMQQSASHTSRLMTSSCKNMPKSLFKVSKLSNIS
ncbi:electron transport complex protein RnfC [Vibrio sp. JCM 18904]|nr:electron transport complex protein RnfC [Vibrio sp. JCM 18904]